MPTEYFEIRIQGDIEGYITFECPYCGSEFKLQAEEYQSDEDPFEELFCPYCGLAKEKDSFISKDVIEQVQAVAYNYMVEELNNSFKKIQRNVNRTKGILKIDYKPLKKIETTELKETDSTEIEFSCSCCERSVKTLYYAGAAKVFCPYCGVDI